MTATSKAMPVLDARDIVDGVPLLDVKIPVSGEERDRGACAHWLRHSLRGQLVRCPPVGEVAVRVDMPVPWLYGADDPVVIERGASKQLTERMEARRWVR